MRIEVVVTDLDGTLWESDTSVHVRTRSAVQHLLDRGVPVLVATGRRVGSTRAPLAAIGLAPPAVVLNGALGVDLSTGDRFHRGGFDAAEAAAVLEIHDSHGVEPCVYVDRDDFPVWIGPDPSTHPDHLASFGGDVAAGDLGDVVASEHVLAFGVLGLDQDVARSLGCDLESIASPHVDRDRHYGGHTVTVAPRARSKWDGVEAFCAARGLDSRAVLALGDGPNDADLLENAAIAVVPADAHPEARRRADHVIGRAVDGGWAEVLELLDVP